ncbi:MAG: glycosyltransferase family 4 protein [Pontibacterium sp.]
MIKKVLYVHYLNTPRDGANTHVTEFKKSFGKICEREQIEFKTISPEMSTGLHSPPTRLKVLKDYIGKFYIRDIKIILEQFKQYKKDKAMLTREKPDMVLVRWNARNLAIFYACRSLNIPVCTEVNGSDSEKSDGNFFIRLPFVERALKTKNLLKLVDGAFVVSDVIKQEVCEQISYDIDLRVIPNGVDCNRFKADTDATAIRQGLSIPADKIVIGYIGTFVPWHRLDWLVDIYKRLSEKYDNLHVLLIGETYPNAVELIKYVHSQGLDEHISFTGHIDMKNVPEYIAAMDIAVLPHTAYYCSPLKLFEYMAMQRAIVSIGTDPVKEIMGENEGTTFIPGDMAAMEATLEKLIASPETRRTLGQNARDKIETLYTWDANAEKVFSLLSDTYQRIQKN